MSNSKEGDYNGKVGNSETHHPDEETNLLPIDRGWVWAILGGCFLNAMLMGGYNRSMALFFVEYLEMFGASTTKTTLILGVRAMSFSLMSLVTMHVVLEFLGTRKAVMLGGLLIVLAILSATFAPNIMVIICVHSVLLGMGNSMIHAPALVLIGKYFKKRRGLATTAASSAMTLASVFPVFSQYLLDEYGVRGTTLIYTGLTMNIWVGASLFRPLHYYERKVEPDRMQEDTVDSIGSEVREVIRDEDAIWSDHGAKHTQNIHNGSTRSCNVVADDTCNGFLDPQSDNESFRKRAYSEGSKRIIKQSVSESEKLLYTSNPDLASLQIIKPKLLDAVSKEIRVDDPNHRKSSIARNIRKVFKAFDFSLFKNPMFLLIVVFCQFGVVVRHVPTYLPAQMKEMGYSQSDAAFLLLISGILDFFCRLFYGFVAYLRVCQIMAIGLLIVGLASQFIMFYTTYPLLVAYCVVIGVFGSAFPCLLPLVIVDFMGVDCMGKTLGFTALFQGFAVALTHPVLGALRDLSGSYLPCFQYLGATSLVAAAQLLCEPLVRHYTAKSTEGSPSKDEECLDPLK